MQSGGMFILCSLFDTFEVHRWLIHRIEIMTLRTRAIAWTFGQYSLFIPLAFGGSVPFPPDASWSSIAGWSLLMASGGLTVWSLWAFRTTRLHLTPLVREGGSLVASGPYRWIRHPMYLAVLLLSAGLTILDPTWMRIGASALMIPALVGKLSVEEVLLRQAYPEYEDLARRTKRLIPGVW